MSRHPDLGARPPCSGNAGRAARRRYRPGRRAAGPIDRTRDGARRPHAPSRTDRPRSAAAGTPRRSTARPARPRPPADRRHPRVGRGRARPGRRGAQHRRALLDEGAGHHITSSAPLLTETEAAREHHARRADAQLDAARRCRPASSATGTAGGATSMVSPPAPGRSSDGDRHCVGREHLVVGSAGAPEPGRWPQKHPARIG